MNNEVSLQRVEKILAKLEEYKNSEHFKQGLITGLLITGLTLLITSIAVLSSNSRDKKKEIEAEAARVAAEEKAKAEKELQEIENFEPSVRTSKKNKQKQGK